MKVLGWRLDKEPVFQHSKCDCKYINTLVMTLEGELIKKVDVYHNCDHPKITPYLIRFSDEPGDYITVTLDSLVAAKVMTTFK